MGQSIAGQNSVMKTIAFASMLTLVCGAALDDFLLNPPPRSEVIGFLAPGPDDIPDLRDCRPWDPCNYEEGDCGESGDEGCDSDLVCGVNNCGDFVPGMTGSCCAQLAGPSTFREEKVPRQWTSWSATWGGWGRQRSRVLTARDGTPSYQWEEQTLN